jgi:hypothetical protein
VNAPDVLLTAALLTAALLGGGADGLHRMIAAFTSLMDKTAAKAKSAE